MILLSSARQRIARLPLLVRAHDCVDETGTFALSYGQKVYLVHARASAADLRDQTGRALRAASGMPRIAMVPRGATRQRALLLEAAATQLATRTSEMDHADWTDVGTPVVTANAGRASDGTLTAELIADTSAVETRGRRQTYTVANDGASYVMAVEVTKRATAHTTGYVLINLRLQGGTGIDAYLVCDAFAGIVLKGAAGTTAGIEDAGAAWRIYLSVTNNGSGNTALLASVYPSGTDAWAASTAVAGQGSEYFARFGVEAGLTPTSHVPRSAAAASRAADVAYFPFLLPPAALTAYARGVERMDANATQPATTVLWSVVNAAGDDAKMYVRRPASASGYRFVHEPVTVTETASVGVAATFGDLVELRAILAATGAPRLGVAINGGAEGLSAVGTAQPLAAAWSATRLYLNSYGSSFQGGFGFTSFAVVPGEVALDELRDLCEVG